VQIRPHIENLPPYTPIEPFEVLSARLGRPPEAIVKLDANENPYGPLPQVLQALAELPFVHIYPDPESRALRQAIAEFLAVPMETILAGAGADELIDLLMRVFLEPGDGVLICPPTFGMYDFDGRLNNARVIEVPRREDFSLDLPALRRVVETERPKVLFLATPNNPDGSLPDSSELEELLICQPWWCWMKPISNLPIPRAGWGTVSAGLGRSPNGAIWSSCAPSASWLRWPACGLVTASFPTG